MILGVPKEVKTKETRVSIVPKGVAELVQMGHTVLVETRAGTASGFSDELYKKAGAQIIAKAKEVWERAELVVKVKEPIETEYGYFRAGLNLFTYLHLASVPQLVEALCKAKVNGIGYETVELPSGELPLLTPMSEVAGRIGSQIGTYLLHANHGGKGLLLGGVTGTSKGQVTVIGAGHVGLNAADVAVGLGANVTIMDIKEEKLRRAEGRYAGKAKMVLSTPQSIADWVKKSDLLVGAVLVSGDKAPTVVSREMVDSMEPGSVIVDVAIDQGGCVETARPTTHAEPTYVECGVTHYCVTNMPALTPRTSTEALTSATIPYVKKLAGGVDKALQQDPALKLGLQTHQGKIVLPVLTKLFSNWA